MKLSLSTTPLMVLSAALLVTATLAVDVGLRRESRSVRNCLRIFCDHNETCYDCAKDTFSEDKEAIRTCIRAAEKVCDRMPSAELAVVRQCVEQASANISTCFAGVASRGSCPAGLGSPTPTQPTAALLNDTAQTDEAVTEKDEAAAGTQGAAAGTQEAAVGSQGAAAGSQGTTVETPGTTVGTPGTTVGTPGTTVETPGAAVGSQGTAVGSQGAAVGTQGTAVGSQGTAVGTQGTAARINERLATWTPEVAIGTQEKDPAAVIAAAIAEANRRTNGAAAGTSYF
ncbi:autotransporter adhesin BpaC-like [Procambarus clarkii]|uniref:autotransporter adhesin BpaC-like n=1 Tax=Procambarus clarkii TaxID=6728 RepID=UPI0037424D0C